jgi:hypothetical protein
MVFTFACAGGTVHASASSAKWVTSGSKIKYKKANGKYVKNKFKKISGEWYYFNEKGYVVTGLKTINGKNYYFTKKGKAGKKGRMQTGWQTIGGKRYYFRTTGSKGVIGSAYQSEWATIDGTKYYFNCDGTLNTNTYLTEQEFVATVGNLARADMQQSGILASVTTAQAILESGYGGEQPLRYEGCAFLQYMVIPMDGRHLHEADPGIPGQQVVYDFRYLPFLRILRTERGRSLCIPGRCDERHEAALRRCSRKYQLQKDDQTDQKRRIRHRSGLRDKDLQYHQTV